MSSELFPAWVNGKIVPPGEAGICVDDLGFQLGLAVFDTLLQERGCRYFEEDHIERLKAGAGSLGLPWPPPWNPAEALAQYADVVDGADCIVRLTYSRGVPGEGPTLVVSGRELRVVPEEGVLVSVEPGAKLAGHWLEAVKATSRLRNVLARDEAMRAGAYEALLCTEEGDVTEGTISNVFVALEGRLVTPELARGVLAGITRDRLLQSAEPGEQFVEGRVEVADLERADEIFLTNSTNRLIPVRGILGSKRVYPAGGGEVFQELRERFSRIEERYRTETEE